MLIPIVAVIVALLAGSIYALWRSHEEAKAERRKFQRIAHAQSESRERVWPAPKGLKGFHRRVSMRRPDDAA